MGNTVATRLAAYLALRAAERSAFVWAGHNCCHFAAGWVRASGAPDPMAGLPATPDARSALRLVRALGGDLPAAFSRQLGSEPIPAIRAQTGDIVLMASAALEAAPAEPSTGFVAGICNGRHVALQTAAGDVAFAPLASALWAWRLPVAGAAA